MAAQHLIDRLVESGAHAADAITLVSDETHAPYDRVHLGAVIDGASAQTLRLREPSWYTQHGVTLRLEQRAVAIDRERRTVRTDAGDELAYDRLVLATGGAPITPPVPGIDRDGVVTYRTLDDVERIATLCRSASRVAVVGGGLLGIEAARAVQRRGCKVCVIERAPRLLPRQLDVEGAAVLEAKLRALDIDLRLQRSVEAIRALDPGVLLCLDDGTSVSADLLIFAVGIRPRDELARAAGLECGRGGGVHVDDAMRTSDPDIYAIGECARHRDQAYGLLAPCYAMADAVAAGLAGSDAAFRPPVASVRLKVDDITVAAVGDWLAEGPTVYALTWLSEDRYRRIVVRNKTIVGAMAVGDGPDLPHIQEAVASETRLRVRHRRRFERTGALWREGGQPPIDQWPDSAVVCACTGVTCGMLRAARARGHRTRLALADATGASRVCGTCTPLIAEIAGETASKRLRPTSRGLGAVSALAAALLCATWVSGPVPMSTSVMDLASVDFLWRSGAWKQASGFTLLGLCVASLLAVLRKRLRRLPPGTFASYRVVHAALGVTTLLAAAVHTGMRLGSNLNFALAMCFITTVLFGAFAGIVTSLERKLSPPHGARLRRAWTWAHLLAFWPMPVLTAFHVLTVYYF
jgi:nitrite reductase (NADH) large subunit